MDKEPYFFEEKLLFRNVPYTFDSLDKCKYAVTNIAGRECCSIFGKRKCKGCEHGFHFTFHCYVVRTKNCVEVFGRPPIKSSLGWLYGYPTKITQKEPEQVIIRRQGTITMAIPPKYRIR